MALAVAAVGIVAVGEARSADRPAATGPCADSSLIPAYSHNDYEQARPLTDALALGYRGVEVDVFLMGGELRVAHDREAARPGRTLEAIYLAPLEERVGRCGRVLADSTPFLLLVELKTRRDAALDSLRAALDRHAELVTTVEEGVVRAGAVEVVLVGWHPALDRLATERTRRFFIQGRMDARGRISPDGPAHLVRLASLDFGKEVGWSGEGPVPGVRRLSTAIERARRDAPGRLARAHNVPPDGRVYRLLIDAGVDRIGTKSLRRTRQLLVEYPGRSW